jgi:hypothetical protein
MRNDERMRMLAHANRQQRRGSQNDEEIYSVQSGDQEYIVMRKSSDFELVNTPEGIVVPRTIGRIKYTLGNDGRSLRSVSNAALCRFGHIVGSESIYTCSHCRESVCRQDSFFIGEKVYCRRKPCNLAGWAYKCFRSIYIVIRYVVGSVLGFETERPAAKPQPNSVPEQDLFVFADHGEVDLNRAEKGL